MDLWNEQTKKDNEATGSLPVASPLVRSSSHSAGWNAPRR